MIQKEIQRLIREIARERGYKEEEVAKIVNTPFLLVAETMRNSDRESVTFPSVRLTGFGLFFCSEKKKEFYRKRNKEKGLNENS